MKLQIGSGEKRLPGYTNVDIIEAPNVDIVCDASDLSNIESSTVDSIYASHVLEHIYPFDVATTLKEWRRILVVGGELRLAVPNFDALVDVYSTTGDIDMILGPLYGRGCKVPMGEQATHKTAYTFGKLETVLSENGFVDIELWDWREFFCGELEGFDDYSQAYIPHMAKDSGILISLNVVAKKA